MILNYNIGLLAIIKLLKPKNDLKNYKYKVFIFINSIIL